MNQLLEIFLEGNELEKMYEYYAAQEVQPTYADFSGDTELSKYARLRKDVFSRLVLPPVIFNGKRVLEFGPDTGENSLVFAQWGARLTLVEPNTEAHPYIRRYFSKFGLEQRLDDVVSASLLDFQPPQKYSVIDAEGFIYSIQPTSAWVAKAGECLELDGFFIISYMELYGSFMELLLKSIYHSVTRDKSYPSGIASAKQLFQPKWDSVAHTRKIESWFMDVIANPFVRRKYFIDPAALLRDMQNGGFRIYSSWPNYKDALAMQWIKAAYSEQAETQAAVDFVEQSRLSHFLGSKCFLPLQLPALSARLAALIDIADSLVEAASEVACKQAQEHIDAILDLIKPGALVATEHEIRHARAILQMIRTIFGLIGKNSADELMEFCRTDKVFISTWGMPNHYAVFQKTREAASAEQ
jgi:hypothetical protein